MRWKWTRERTDEWRDDAVEQAKLSAEILNSVRERGVTAEYARDVAERSARTASRMSGARRAGFIDGAVEGIADSWRAQSEAGPGLDKRLREIREVERLMGAFSGELSKLDEVLEVLSAYVRRMRTTQPETHEPRTLH